MYWQLVIIIFGSAASIHGFDSNDILTQRWTEGQWSNVFDCSNAVVGGHRLSESGNILVQYVCRVKTGREFKPGKFRPDNILNCCYITNATADEEVGVCDGSRIQFLQQDHRINKFAWVAARDGGIVDGAVIGGQTEESQPYFICRADINYSGQIFPYSGSLLPQTGFCSVSFYQAFKIPVYHVLRDENYIQLN